VNKKIKDTVFLIVLTLFSLASSNNFCIQPRGENLALETVKNQVKLPQEYIKIVQSVITDKPTISEEQFPCGNHNLPLFQAFPELRNELPHISLGNLPTPVTKIATFGRAIGLENVYIKSDNLTGGYADDGQPLFGGNKVRKLEFLLADALYNDTKSVITFGGVGSNHALATMTYAQQLGLKGIAILAPQSPSAIVKRNLSLNLYHNAQLHLCQNKNIRNLCIVYTMLREKQLNGVLPYIIPVGGSCPTGIVGFVNAAFELKKQIEEGQLPEPDVIYVPLGSMGTAAGLLLGIKAAGLKTKIIGVAVAFNPNYKKTVNLARKTNKFLHELDPSFPLFSFSKKDFEVLRGLVGKGYGIFTQEGEAAINLIYETQNVTLDGVYTGKGLSGLIANAHTHSPDDIILFWNTFCGDDFAHAVQSVDYKDLPVCFHQYFEA